MSSADPEADEPIDPKEFNPMVDLMLNSNSSLEELIRSNAGRLQYPAYLLFGASGAGKSTLLARLRSNKSKEEFAQVMEAGGRGKVEECGIALSGGLISCTTVPQLCFEELFDAPESGPVFDMPGIKDTQTFRRTVISITQRCFYAKLTKAKFLVVMNIHLFTDKAQVTNTYHSELLELFGADNFENFISSCYFVFTNVDRHPDIAEKRFEIMGKWFVDLAKMKEPAIGPFISRIYEHHCVINYSTDGREEVLIKLNTLLQGEGRPFNPRELKTGRLIVRGNRLNIECLKKLKTMEKELNEKYAARITDVFNVEADAIVKNVETLLGYAEEYKNGANEVDANIRKIARIESDITLADEKIADYKKRETETRADVEQYNQQKENFLTLAKQIKSAEMFAFYSFSKPPGGWGGGGPIEMINITAVRPVGIIGEPVIIAFEPEHFNTFKQEFRNKKSFDDAIDTGAIPVLFHSSKAIRTGALELQPLSSIAEGLAISGKSRLRFVIAYVYETLLSEGNKDGVVTTFYTGLIKESASKLEIILKGIRTSTNQKLQSEEELEALQSRNSILTLRLPQIGTLFDELQRKIVDNVTILQNQMESMADEVERNYNQGEFGLKLKKIGDILAENRLGMDMRHHLDKNRELANEIKAKVARLKSNLDKELKKAQSCKLTK